MLEITDAARAESEKLSASLNSYFQIDGVSTIYSSATLETLIRIGDAGLLIGDDWVIGGYRELENSSSYQMFNKGGTKINQQINADKGQGSSTSLMSVTLLDKNESISQLISPDFDLSEIIGVGCVYKIGFANTDYSLDYISILRGVIVDIESGPGFVTFYVTNTEEKKRKTLWELSTAKNNIPISSGGTPTTITVSDPIGFYNPILGPDGGYDTSLETYVRMNDEFFIYTSVSGYLLSGVTRAQLGTTAGDHAVNDEVTPYFRLTGNGVDLALKIMLSGWGGYQETGVAIKNFVQISPTISEANAIFFNGVDVESEYGLSEGDYITTTGASNGANNVTLKQIASIDKTNYGSLIVVDGVSFVSETDTAATISFRSQYDTLPFGLKMKMAEVDVKEFQKIKDRFLSVFPFDFLETDIRDAREFLEKQIFLAMACFSIPRKGRSSLAHHHGPISDDEILTLDIDSVLNAEKLKVKRSTSKNFANSVIFEYDTDRLNGDFNTRTEYYNQTAVDRINLGKKPLSIQSNGLTTANGAASLSQQTANRLLSRYELGAEFITGIELHMKYGFRVEIGDIVRVDYASLKLTDTTTGNRDGTVKLMEVTNRSYDTGTGIATIEVTNTIYGTQDRFGLISPSSLVDVGSTTTILKLKRSFSTKEYHTETRKWRAAVGETIKVYSPDWTFNEDVTLVALGDDGFSMAISPALSMAPSENYLIGAPDYDSGTDTSVNSYWKSKYASLSDEFTVQTGVSGTQFTLTSGDAARLSVGNVVRVHNFSYSNDSGEVKITDVTGTTITVEAMGYTPSSGDVVDLIPFSDGGYSYKYL